MPLNLKDTDETPSNETSSSQPILHTPEERKPVTRKVIFVFFILVVLGSASFLIYVFTSLKIRNQSSGEMLLTQPTDTSSVAVLKGSGSSSEQKEEGATSSKPTTTRELQPHTGTGRYTLFISSHIERNAAEEEVGRWNEAGYQASVVEAAGHYRVALGQYSGVNEARKTAEVLDDAFEDGYWVGTLQ